MVSALENLEPRKHGMRMVRVVTVDMLVRMDRVVSLVRRLEDLKSENYSVLYFLVTTK